jgi:hypothetical protein
MTNERPMRKAAMQGQFLFGADIAVFRRVDQWTDLTVGPSAEAEMKAILTREVTAAEARIEAALQALDSDVWTVIEYD